MADLDLDVDTPEKVAEVLRRAAQRFYESAGELESAWQDKNAGKVWERMARILERAADSCEGAL
jgi:acyl-CoA reductase-like NAD-dependent aldehyde dehydrogenase